MASLDGTIVNVSLPTMTADLGSNLSTIAWVTIAYRLVSATLLLTFGRLSDMIGSKPIYAYGFAIFTVGSGLAGIVAGSAEELVAYRVIQGVGSAMMLSNGFAIVTSVFPLQERGKAIGMMSISWTLGSSLGPALGGILLAQLGWRSIFTINLPIGLLGFLMARRFLEDTKRRPEARMDYLGTVTFVLALAPFLVALREISEAGSLVNVLIMLSVSVASLIALVIHERRVDDALLDLKLIRRPFFAASVIGRVGMVGSLAVVDLMVPFYLTGVLGYSPLFLGLLLISLPLTFGVVGSLSGWFSDKVGVLPLVLVGSFTMALTHFFFSMTMVQFDSVANVLLVLMFFGAASGLFFIPNSSGLMGDTPDSRKGFTSSVLPSSWNIGHSIGSAVASLTFTVSIPALSAVSLGELLRHGSASAAPVIVPGLQASFMAGGVMALSAILFYLVWGRRVQKMQ
ncbi:MAG: MFS transporter [Thaumarchaeota archaeon]|nr:MFS transporter [Nitrososphaerota archaeon]